MWEKRQCFKEKSKKTKFSTSSIIKKIKSTKIIMKKKYKEERQFWEKFKETKKKHGET